MRAYLATREVFCFGTLWKQIEALDNRVADAVQAEMLDRAGRRTVRATTWFLRSRRLAEPIEQTIDGFAPAARAMLKSLQAAPPSAAWRAPIVEMREGYVRQGVPAPLADEVAAASTLLAALDLAEVAEASRQPLETVASAYFSIGESLGLARLRTQVSGLPSDGYWQALAKAATNDDLASLQRQLTADALAAGGLDAWQRAQAPALDRARRLLGELAESKSADLAMFVGCAARAAQPRLSATPLAGPADSHCGGPGVARVGH